MKSVFPIILIVASLCLFFFYTNGEYQSIKGLQADIASYDIALGKSEQVLKKRGELEAKWKLFKTDDLNLLSKLLPDHVDNVQLIMEINGIAEEHHMQISKIKIDQSIAGANNVALGPTTKPYSTLQVSFRTQSSYADFMVFMKALEKGLRLVDITDLSFRASEKDLNDYSVSFKTYWLK